jgi:cysteine synthase B
MILHGEHTGDLVPGKIILDATSGNTGIAYAMIGACLGYGVALCLPANASDERKNILRTYGAEIFETDPAESTDGAQVLARHLAASEPDKYFYPDQYNNDANWRAHYEYTGPEILNQTSGQITHFVAGLGTTGTFVGIARRLKKYNSNINVIAVQPDSPLHGLEGMKHLKSAIIPGIYDPVLPDNIVEVSTEDAFDIAAKLGREEGLLVGPSSGANVSAALNLAKQLPSGSVVVTILCDRGERYFSHTFRKEHLSND